MARKPEKVGEYRKFRDENMLRIVVPILMTQKEMKARGSPQNHLYVLLPSIDADSGNGPSCLVPNAPSLGLRREKNEKIIIRIRLHTLKAGFSPVVPHLPTHGGRTRQTQTE